MLYLILGLIIGFYARTIFDYSKGAYTMLKEKFEYDKTGIVKPEFTRATRNQPRDLSSETGGIRKLTPDEVLTERAKERERRLQIR